MASKEIQRMFLRGITPSEQPPQETKKLIADGDLLIEIKHIYDSWPYDDVTLKQALLMYKNDIQKSNLVKNQERLSEIKNTVGKILQEQDIKLETLYCINYARGYKEETLRRFGDNPDLKNSLLEDIFKRYPGMDDESQQKREELVAKALADGTAFRKRDDTWHETSQHTFINSQKNNPTSITVIPRELPKPKLVEPSKIELPTIESPPNTQDCSFFEKKPFLEKFEIIQGIKKEYSMDSSQTNRNIPFLTAVQLVQSGHEDNPTKKEISLSKPEVISSLTDWFKRYLPEFGINDINDISYKSFLTFLNVNPNIINLFDDADLENKLSRSIFEMITQELTSQYQRLQQFVPQFLLSLSMEERSNESVIQNFIRQCKVGFNFDANNEEQMKRISIIYSTIKEDKTTSSTSKFIEELLQ